MQKAERLASCGAWCATAQLEDGSYIAVPLTCRSWDCPHCQHVLRRRLLRRLRLAKVTLFITLTTSPRTAASPDDAFQVASNAIGSLFKRWRRKFPDSPVEYFLVWERTKRGWPHAHILVSGPRPSKHWLSHTWNELTGSFVTDLQPVTSAQHAAGYVTKYLTKDPQVPTGQRRFRRSAGFFHTQNEPPPFKLQTVNGWKRKPLHTSTQAFLWLNERLALTIDASGIVRARDDPDLWAEQMRSTLPYRLRTQLQNSREYMDLDH